MERVKERLQTDALKQSQKVASFAALRDSASDVYDEMVGEQLQYKDLAASALKTLVSYVFQARKETGASKHTGTKAACLTFLEGVPVDDLKDLIDTPPNEPVAAVNAIALAASADQPPMLALCSNQLVLDVDLPDGMVVQAQPPDWLGAALEHGSETASSLVGKSITYKWPALLGGWLLGKVTKVNTDKAQKLVPPSPTSKSIMRPTRSTLSISFLWRNMPRAAGRRLMLGLLWSEHFSRAF